MTGAVRFAVAAAGLLVLVSLLVASSDRVKQGWGNPPPVVVYVGLIEECGYSNGRVAWKRYQEFGKGCNGCTVQDYALWLCHDGPSGP
jgi:hypothetical protein